jgi:hypothetical protein
MVRRLFIVSFALFLMGCSRSEQKQQVHFPSHVYTVASISKNQISNRGKMYIPVFSEIYHVDGSKRFVLTSTLSIRNICLRDTFYLFSADYYDSSGKLLRKYIDSTLQVNPLESVEFVVEDAELQGGAGAKFIVEWGSRSAYVHPYMCAVMIGTGGQQGISFMTEGIEIPEENR